MNANPLGRRRQLGAAILSLRTAAGLSHRTLAERVGISGSTISRIEACTAEPHRRPDLAMVLDILDALKVPRGSEQWAELQRLAEGAAAKGWWDAKQAVTNIGEGQRDYALAEHGAKVIREYGGMLVPGLAQEPSYARERIIAALPPGEAGKADGILDGRAVRQQVILGDAPAEYRLLLEVQAVYRSNIEQIRHLRYLAERPNISIRIIPANACLDGHAPRAPYSHVTYWDDDPEIVMVDDVGRALVVDDQAEINRYVGLHERLTAAAMTEDETARFLAA